MKRGRPVIRLSEPAPRVAQALERVSFEPNEAAARSYRRAAATGSLARDHVLREPAAREADASAAQAFVAWHTSIARL